MPKSQRPRRSQLLSFTRPKLEHLEDRTTPAFPAVVDLSTLAAGSGVTLTGFEDNARAGESVAGIGDINGDGLGDIAVVAPLADGGGTNKGQVHVIFGTGAAIPATFALTGLNGTNGFTITGLADNDELGEPFEDGAATVAALGDVNGDGIDDFVIGDDEADGGGTNKGQAFVIFGSKTPSAATFNLATLNGTNGFTITGAADNDQIGGAVGGGADVNGDGVNDVLVGSPRIDGGGTDKGAVFVVFGSKTAFATDLNVSALNGANGFALLGIADNDNLGGSVAGLGDVNGDGVDDFVAGAQSADGGGTDKGQAYVVFGSKTAFAATINAGTLNGATGFSVTGKTDSQFLGEVVGSAGDFNGDGLADVVIGQRLGEGKGQAHVLFGHSTAFPANVPIESLNGTTGFTVTGLNANDELGHSVAGGADINSDGLDDVVVGAPGVDNGGTNKGTVYVLFGTKAAVPAAFDLAALNGANGFAIRGVADNDQAGFSVGVSDDATGDGADDLVVGAPTADVGGTNKGSAYVVFGIDETAPTATLAEADVTRSSDPLAYSFQVTYADFGEIDPATLGDADVQVVAPNGTVIPATFVSSATNAAGDLVATYKITPPGGRWDATDRGDYTVRVVASEVADLAGNFVAAGNLDTFAVNVSPVSQNEVVRFAVGPGDTGGGIATVFNADGTTAFSVTAFPGSTNGARVVTADVNGDGVDDLVVGTGPGEVTSVRVFDGKTQAVIFTVQPFEAAFTGGVYVAAADLDGDGKAEVIVTPDEGGGPVVAIYGGARIVAGKAGDAAQLTRFFGIEDENFRGGARAATADVDGDGVQDLLVAAGFGGGPRIAVFNGAAVLTPVASGKLPPKLFGDFFVFEDTLRNGVFITGGDLDGDGFGDVVAGGGPGGGPRVFGLSGQDLVAGKQTPVANFFAGDPDGRGGVRIAVKDLDGDGKFDLVTGAGDAEAAAVNTYLGKNIVPDVTPPADRGFTAFPGFLNGVFVG